MNLHRKAPQAKRASIVGIWACIALGVIAFSSIAAAQQAAGRIEAGSIIAGWVENAWLGSPPIKLEAKLDTGAMSSSINAPDAEEFWRDGARWVRFRIVSGGNPATTIEQPIVRHARIGRAGVGKEERPVIKLEVCVGGHTAETDFTLADRSGMTYQILIGRRFMTDRILVNSAETYLVSGRCDTGN